jgi:hypothetical protein
MNVYHPYDTLIDNTECLHLKQNESRERLQFITLRVVPILLMLVVWYVLQRVGSVIPMNWNYVLIIVTLIVAFLLLFRSYTTEIKIIKNKEIFLVLKTVFGTKEKTIVVNQIKKISMIRKSGKSSDISFVLNVKPNKSYLLLNIPPLAFDAHHLRLIKERFEDLLAMHVEEFK